MLPQYKKYTTPLIPLTTVHERIPTSSQSRHVESTLNVGKNSSNNNSGSKPTKRPFGGAGSRFFRWRVLVFVFAVILTTLLALQGSVLLKRCARTAPTPPALLSALWALRPLSSPATCAGSPLADVLTEKPDTLLLTCPAGFVPYAAPPNRLAHRYSLQYGAEDERPLSVVSLRPQPLIRPDSSPLVSPITPTSSSLVQASITLPPSLQFLHVACQRQETISDPNHLSSSFSSSKPLPSHTPRDQYTERTSADRFLESVSRLVVRSPSMLLPPVSDTPADGVAGSPASSVLVLLIRGLSLDHYRRALPRLRATLLSRYADRLLEFTSYQPVHTDALSNQLALFGGITEKPQPHPQPQPQPQSQQPPQRSRSQSEHHTASPSWLWQRYREAGYRTLYLEEGCHYDQSVKQFFDDAEHAMFSERFTELYCQAEVVARRSALPLFTDLGLVADFSAAPLEAHRQHSVPRQPFASARLHRVRAPSADEQSQLAALLAEQLSLVSGSSSSSLNRNRRARRSQPPHLCLGDRYLHELSLEYAAQFLLAGDRLNTPRFATVSLDVALEPSLSRVSTLDLSLRSFLQLLEDEGTLDHTTVLLLSDTGNPLPPYAETPAGAAELLRPFLTVLLPAALSPEHVELLRSNHQRMVTPLDVHRTLFSLATELSSTRSAIHSPAESAALAPTPIERSFAVPLHLQEVDLERSCAQAAVNVDACGCDDLTVYFLVLLLLPVSILSWWCYVWFVRRS